MPGAKARLLAFSYMSAYDMWSCCMSTLDYADAESECSGPSHPFIQLWLGPSSRI